MSAPPPPKPGGGLSLYADLLDPPTDSSASISRAPVVSQEALDAVKEKEAVAAKKVDSALRFQPFQSIRRPQQKSQKPKPGFPKAPSAASSNFPAAGTPPAAPTTAAQAPVKSTLADWAPTEEDEWMYAGAGSRRPRKKKKKNRDNALVETNWDDIYDPSRPTNVEEYLRSDERIREVREWKALLYRHRRPEKRRSSFESDEEDERPMNNQFAPPQSYSFAPPPPSPPRAPLPDDKTGDDAYARRLAMSRGVAIPPPARPPSPPPPPPETPTTSAPPPPNEPDLATISRAPVRYAQPEPALPQPPPEPEHRESTADTTDEGVPESEVDQPRTSRPGQKGFAARLMAKYGWSKGKGLGAENTGMLQPLRVQVEKRKKRPDSEGGGWAEPGGRGRIIEGKRAKDSSSSSSSYQDSGGGKFGPMSSVIVLRHMLDGLPDVQAEMEEGLGQEIGEECGDKYGRVERLYIDVEGRCVYIKFVDQVSALRAVNALDGRVFAGNAIEPKFYDAEKFEKGIYERNG